MPDTKETFDSISKNYDFINQLISFGLHRKWKSNFINTVNFYGKVIDIATGTGDIAMEIKKKHPDANLTGYDPSPNMLDIAKKNVLKMMWILLRVFVKKCHLMIPVSTLRL